MNTSTNSIIAQQAAAVFDKDVIAGMLRVKESIALEDLAGEVFTFYNDIDSILSPCTYTLSLFGGGSLERLKSKLQQDVISSTDLLFFIKILIASYYENLFIRKFDNYASKWEMLMTVSHPLVSTKMWTLLSGVINQMQTCMIVQSSIETHNRIRKVIDEKELYASSLKEEIDNKAENARIEFEGFKKNMHSLKVRQDHLKESLKKLEFEYNFVALSLAFKNMLTQKEKELKPVFNFMMILGVLMLLIPAAGAFSFYLDTGMAISLKDKEIRFLTKILLMTPFVGGEIILFYFFRISLQRYNSITGQILQLNLRQSLCSFVEGYANWRKDAFQSAGTGGNSDQLAKFEGLIFSNIMPEPDKLPSTFDGLEQIVETIKKIKP